MGQHCLSIKPLSAALEEAIRRQEAESREIDARYAPWPDFIVLSTKRLWSVQDCETYFPLWQKKRQRFNGRGKEPGNGIGNIAVQTADSLESR